MNEEQIAAYLLDELEPPAKSEFEHRLTEDAELRREIEAFREALGLAHEWAEADAPGVERADSLPLPEAFKQPSLVKSSGLARVLQLPLRKTSWQAVAAAAIFLVGVWVGAITQERELNSSSSPINKTPIAERNQTPQVEQQQTERQAAVDVAQADDVRPPAARRYSRDEHGRLTIASAPASGGSSIWVIDGSFKLAQSLIEDQEEEQE